MSTPHWGYGPENGPSHWAKDFPSAAGIRQSPIDIKTHDAHYDSALNIHPLKVQYNEGKDFNIANNGHSLVISRKASEGSHLSGGPLDHDHNYRFEQFHFHWGKTSANGSEHLLDGKAFPAELHLVHWNTDLFDSFGEAATSKNGLAVLGAFVKIGGESAGLKTITGFTSQVQNVGDKQDLKIPFNLTSMLPTNTKDYWTYDGSLTTPPCSESVTWFVFKEPIHATENQMQKLRALKSNAGECIVDNYRPVMDLGGRTVKASFE
jgi:carbonic anhydrase